MKSEIFLYVNDTRYELSSGRYIHTTLAEFIRNDCRLKGTKIGCGEGGCGACTCIVAKLSSDGIVDEYTVNSCITPVLSLNGCAVTTIEGLGDSKHPHAVQERLAKLHGTQCGFCTPGMTMSIYNAIVKAKGKPTVEQMEKSIEGNLCRCTGYRPILDVAKSFCDVRDIEDFYACDRGKQVITPSGIKCVQTSTFNKCNGEFPFSPDDNASVFIKDFEVKTQLPLELQRSSMTLMRPETIRVEGVEGKWMMPVTLAEMQSMILEEDGDVIICGGNAGFKRISSSRIEREGAPATLLSPMNVAELGGIRLVDNDLQFGASVTITALIEFLRTSQGNNTILMKLEHIASQFGARQIRNCTSIGGHVLSSPQGDLIPLLLALSSKVTVLNVEGGLDTIPLESLLHLSKLPKGVILVSFTVKCIFTDEYPFVDVIKVSPRRDNSIGTVTGAIVAHLDRFVGNITQVKLCFSGINWKVISCPITSQHLISGDQSLIKSPLMSIVDGALPVLSKELYDHHCLQKERDEEYRVAVALGIFKKFLLQMKAILQSPSSSGLNHHEISFHRVTSGLQEWEESKGHLLKSNPVFETSTEEKRDPVGQPVRLLTGLQQATGEATYVDDIPIPEGCLYASLVKSTVPHARIISTDETPALAFPGVIAYFDQRHLCPREKAVKVQAEKVFATDEVTCIGMVIGVVVAATQEIADRAAKLVDVKYEILPAVFTIEEAIEKGSYFPWSTAQPHKVIDGDIHEAFNNRDCVILEGELKVGGQEHFYLEPHALLVLPGECDDVEILSMTQCTTKTQALVAGCLGIPRSKVNVKVKRIGGAFGGKEVRSTYTSGVLAIAATILKRPIKWLLTRGEDMQITGGRHPFLHKWKAAVHKSTGRIQGLSVKMFANGGNTASTTEDVMNRGIMHVCNAYKISAVQVEGYLCYTNLPSNTAYRGFGAPQTMMVIETVMDAASKALCLPREELQFQNLMESGMHTHYGQLVPHCRLKEMFEDVMNRSEFHQRRAKIDEFNISSPIIKRGIAITPTLYGISFPVKYLNQAGATVSLYPDGSCILSHAAVDMGQGINTKMAQIAARAFGIPVSKVHVSDCSVDKVPNTAPTAASVGSDLNGMAVLDACEQILARLQPLREKYKDKSFPELCEAAVKARICLSSTGFFSTPRGGNYNWDMETKDNKLRGEPFNYFVFGVGCSEVEVDSLSGCFKVTMTDLLMDCGDSLNPVIDIGQVEGSFIQGMGWLTSEELLWGEGGGGAEEGRNAYNTIPPGLLHNNSPHGYKIPGPSDTPIDLKCRLLSGNPNPFAIHSSKAVGEPPFFLSGSVFFAIKDAIYAARRERSSTEKREEEAYFRLDAPATMNRIRMSCSDNILEEVERVFSRKVK